LCHRQAGQPDEAGKAVEALLQLPCADSVSLRVAARILLAAGRTDRALSAAKKFLPEAGPEDISGQLEALPPDVSPLFYNY
jgi:predicted Zn-dependent protease